MSSDIDLKWMQHALMLADKAQQQGEVPVGAVVVLDEEIIGEGWNQPISMNDPTAHAEIIAMRSAASRLGNYRLPKNTTLYVTLEPCAMCAGAMMHARIGRLVFGAPDPKTGAAGSVFDIATTVRLNHSIDVSGEVLAEDCAAQLRQFFKAKR